LGRKKPLALRETGPQGVLFAPLCGEMPVGTLHPAAKLL